MLEAASAKFARDGEFRTYVQRYIRQFEELYAQARASDHGAMLTVALGSGDIARLYDLLTQVAGAASALKGEESGAKAA